MEEHTALFAILEELTRAESIYPEWPTDPVHAVAVLEEESGETMKAALNYCYHDGDLDRIKEEAIQTGAMAIRVLKGLKSYRRVQGY